MSDSKEWKYQILFWVKIKIEIEKMKTMFSFDTTTEAVIWKRILWMFFLFLCKNLLC